jgi:hypothetical protein
MTVRFQSLTHELLARESTAARDWAPVAVRVKEVTAGAAGLPRGRSAGLPRGRSAGLPRGRSAALEGVAVAGSVDAGFVHLLEAEFTAVPGTGGNRSEIAGIHIV